jgi:hypothetical protein
VHAGDRPPRRELRGQENVQAEDPRDVLLGATGWQELETHARERGRRVLPTSPVDARRVGRRRTRAREVRGLALEGAGAARTPPAMGVGRRDGHEPALEPRPGRWWGQAGRQHGRRRDAVMQHLILGAELRLRSARPREPLLEALHGLALRAELVAHPGYARQSASAPSTVARKTRPSPSIPRAKASSAFSSGSLIHSIPFLTQEG